ncbi:lactate utilization protein [Flavobacteriaceae bacterium]|nr:lactate utilization protein [Flavobacteriaceae bacterium]
MSVFRKIFGSISKSDKEQQKNEDENKFLPKKDTPIDESFTIHFSENGGKFLYCETINEVYDFLQQIIKENNWEDKFALLLNSELNEKFKDVGWKTTETINEGHFLFTTCEYLIANDGSILISSNQIAEKKLNELPKNFIVFATTSQIVQTIGEGLHGIKAKNKKNIPTNITTIKHFKATEDDNFLSYGSSSKNLYLLMLEDL